MHLQEVHKPHSVWNSPLPQKDALQEFLLKRPTKTKNPCSSVPQHIAPLVLSYVFLSVLIILHAKCNLTDNRFLDGELSLLLLPNVICKVVSFVSDNCGKGPYKKTNW